MLDGTAANHAAHELDAVRRAVDEGRYAEAALRIEVLEAGLTGRDPAVVDVWQRLLRAERARAADGERRAQPRRA